MPSSLLLIIWLFFLLTLIKNDDNGLISEQGSIYSSKLDKKHFVKLSSIKVVINSNIHANAPVTINPEDNGFVSSKVVRTSCGIKYLFYSKQQNFI